MFRYVVISPIRNEEEFLPLTIASMCAQTVRPAKWVLVNDGSSDRTAELINQAAEQFDWIVSVHRKDRGSRQAGGGVIEAFYDGYSRVKDDNWDFIVKLDGDLSFDADYFERCFQKFAADDLLGVAGGTCCKPAEHGRTPEFVGEPSFHVRGPTKLYRRECFAAIGGLIKAPGWDTIDIIKANMLGWKTRSFPDITLIHHRPTGGAYGSWANWVKNGLANYITGYHPAFMAIKCLRRTLRRPSLAGLEEGAGLFFGFMKGYIRRIPQVSDPQMIGYVRAQQMRALTLRTSLWR